MSKVFILCFIIFAFGCGEITQSQIDEAARIQNKNKSRCELIANSLEAKAEFIKSNGDWVCILYKKNHLNNRWGTFYINELYPIYRYIILKNNN